MGGSGLKMLDGNIVTWILLGIVVFSLLQGIRRGASGSVRQLLSFVIGALIAVVSVVLSVITATKASPWLQDWLTEHGMARPEAGASALTQIGYTVVSALRDLPLLRYAFLFLLIHTLIRLVTGLIGRLFVSVISFPFAIVPAGGTVSRTVGGLIGAALGTGRALLVTALLFAYCAILPHGPMTGYIEQSGLYKEAAAEVIQPATGQILEEQLPVFAQAMSSELDQLWQKRYDVIDAELPSDIVTAAVSATEGSTDEEGKARALYNYVGSNVAYDYDKVKAYEELGEWREQNPEQTFRTRLGVCIDYARLYAAMARSVGLDVRVVTGLGYDGHGGYGPHAWNEVYLSKQQKWIPLDSTWARTGNWFDSPGFADTHIRQTRI
jgi:hypothetical protein